MAKQHPNQPLRKTALFAGLPAIGAGLIAGGVHLVLLMVLVPLFTPGSPWAPVRLMASIALGPQVLPPPGGFDLVIVASGLVVHFFLSILYAMLVAAVVHRLERRTALLVGAALGGGIYVTNYYGFSAVFPWVATARHWVTSFTHLMFGLVAAWAYQGWRQRWAVRAPGVAQEPPEQRRAA